MRPVPSSSLTAGRLAWQKRMKADLGRLGLSGSLAAFLRLRPLLAPTLASPSSAVTFSPLSLTVSSFISNFSISSVFLVLLCTTFFTEASAPEAELLLSSAVS